MLVKAVEVLGIPANVAAQLETSRRKSQEQGVRPAWRCHHRGAPAERVWYLKR